MKIVQQNRLWSVKNVDKKIQEKLDKVQKYRTLESKINNNVKTIPKKSASR